MQFGCSVCECSLLVSELFPSHVIDDLTVVSSDTRANLSTFSISLTLLLRGFHFSVIRFQRISQKSKQSQKVVAEQKATTWPIFSSLVG